MWQLGHLQSNTRQKLCRLLLALPLRRWLSGGLHLQVPQLAETLAGSNAWWSAATSLKKPRCKDFCARTLKSPTLEDCGIENFSQQPLGKATVTWSISRQTPMSTPGPVSPIEPNFFSVWALEQTPKTNSAFKIRCWEWFRPPKPWSSKTRYQVWLHVVKTNDLQHPKSKLYWLVVSTPPTKIWVRQLGFLFPIYGKS